MEKILIIDDDEGILDSLRLDLRDSGYRIFTATNGYEGLELVKRESPDVVITDLRMPQMTGLEVLRRCKSIDRDLPVIIVTAYEDFQSAIHAMQLDAYDYLMKPVEKETFVLTVKRAINSRKETELSGINIPSYESEEYQVKNKLVGNNPAMLSIYKTIGKISGNRISVLIQGESGTGKELVGKVIHYSGITKNFPFVGVNCTALSQSLLESELFGHVRGSFTGAIKDKKGKFELAGEGTIFLDEISEISPGLQVKLLRVLQEREFEKVGGEITIPMKARVIAATNKDLKDLVDKGQFREDLFYRLNVLALNIPPLRERKDDIPNLAVNLLTRINKELHKNVHKIPYSIMERLINYEWVGNVRELQNVLMQAVVLSKGDILEDEYIILKDNNHSSSGAGNLKTNMSLAEIEKEHIKLVLEHVKWNKQMACKILGITKPTLNSRIEQYSITHS